MLHDEEDDGYETVYIHQKESRILDFDCRQCGQRAVPSDLTSTMAMTLARRVQRTHDGDGAPPGKGTISCRRCRHRAQDLAPKRQS